MRIATIGARDISLKTSNFLSEIGKMIVEHGNYIASGGANGSDSSFARGANLVDPTKVIIYLPWESYNKELIVKGNHVTWQIKLEWEEIAARHHPKWANLKDSVRKLMARNAGIISRADKVIAYPNINSPFGGGTSHSMRVAKEKGIPILDLTEKEHSLEEVGNWLKSS